MVQRQSACSLHRIHCSRPINRIRSFRMVNCQLLQRCIHQFHRHRDHHFHHQCCRHEWPDHHQQSSHHHRLRCQRRVQHQSHPRHLHPHRRHLSQHRDRHRQSVFMNVVLESKISSLQIC
ncbi:unnamed protein product [Gongylonema pulchrum]|uniref:Uncharacterized protein n=1 Tax=Gongylonema pulchrum TaxID=637853 RepID=A0A183DID3_9BILA|nr:unnamed protein product [Gongylonema pulchrum]